jgi:hypothetical protein
MTLPAGRPLIVFLGPTASIGEAETVLQAIYLPPAAQGAIVSAVKRYDPWAILLIDGVFQGEPAVRHKELLWAISRGIAVFGAASMGALRAAELYRQGMVGIGRVFRWYRRFALLSDDAVAVLHGPAELGSVPVTQALIDLRLSIRRAERRGVIDKVTRGKLESAAAKLNFRDRTLANVIDAALGNESDHACRAEMTAGIARHSFSQKKVDALTALRLLHNLSPSHAWRDRPRTEFVTTTAFLRDLRHAGINSI